MNRIFKVTLPEGYEKNDIGLPEVLQTIPYFRSWIRENQWSSVVVTDHIIHISIPDEDAEFFRRYMREAHFSWDVEDVSG